MATETKVGLVVIAVLSVTFVAALAYRLKPRSVGPRNREALATAAATSRPNASGSSHSQSPVQPDTNAAVNISRPAESARHFTKSHESHPPSDRLQITTTPRAVADRSTERAVFESVPSLPQSPPVAATQFAEEISEPPVRYQEFQRALPPDGMSNDDALADVEAPSHELSPDDPPSTAPDATRVDRADDAEPRTESTERKYVVQPGDTLSDIARRELGDPARWFEIYDSNRRLLRDYSFAMKPGTELILPADRQIPQSAEDHSAWRQIERR